MPILPGDELTGDCQYVGNTPIQPHKADNGVLARATEADLDAAGDDVDVIRTGMVILSSRKQAYIDAYAALGLGVCDEDDAPFAAENAPLMIRFEPAGDLQVWLTGRDFNDYVETGSDPEYWQMAFDRLVAYAASNASAGRTKIVVLIDFFTSDGTYVAVESYYFPSCSTLPAGWTLHICDESIALGPGLQVTDYFAGAGTDTLGGSVAPDETALLIVGGMYARADDPSLMATLTANVAAIRGILQAGGSLMAWSQYFTDYDPDSAQRGDPMAVGWTWLDDLFPGIAVVGLGTYPYPYVATATGEVRCPGMTAAIVTATDTAQSAFTGDLNGLAVLLTTGDGVPVVGPAGTYNLDIGGVPNL